ncbi:unnamed protein product [Darwinula stevensoni]|uniref:START domain-containing protein n=1 Tax=Darwinula stevensoni TaxID=69355 RepID=A0A7R9AF59_9CRUS|nr:unnamed protein product [Darwinula stevensoni]CAG0902066.1 unnamed protein product [Darwinula stevensoni]
MSDFLHPKEEKCESEGESALEKFRFNLERKDWTLEKEYKQEGITIKSTYDEEAKAYFILTEALLDFEFEWLFLEMRDHTFEATPEWFSACKKLTIVKRLTEVCWVVHEVLEPQLGGIVASRDVVFHSHVRKIGKASFISLCSTEWPGMQSKKKIIRAEIVKGSGQTFSPDPDLATRTHLRWVMSVDYKIPLVPVKLLMPFHVETARQYVMGLKKYLAVRRDSRSGTVQDCVPKK